MSGPRRVRAVVVGLLLVGTALGVVAGITDGVWTTAASGFAGLAMADTVWSNGYTRPTAAPRRRAASLAVLALAFAGVVAAFVAASGAARAGLALMGLGLALVALAAVTGRLRTPGT